jgi:hypothetical protein
MCEWSPETKSKSAELIFHEMNLARQFPVFLKQEAQWYLTNAGPPNGNGNFVGTREGAAAVRDLIKFLESPEVTSAPFLPFEKYSRQLCCSASLHCNDIGPKGVCEHSGVRDLIETYADWSGQLNENLTFGTSRTARDIVLQLCIDDGVPNRGHRGVIFSRRMRFAGVAVGDHREAGNMCCIHYAEYCEPKKGATGRELFG